MVRPLVAWVVQTPLLMSSARERAHVFLILSVVECWRRSTPGLPTQRQVFCLCGGGRGFLCGAGGCHSFVCARWNVRLCCGLSQGHRPLRGLVGAALSRHAVIRQARMAAPV